MTKSPLRVVVTGAAGQISYSLLGLIAKGDVFGKFRLYLIILLVILISLLFLFLQHKRGETIHLTLIVKHGALGRA